LPKAVLWDLDGTLVDSEQSHWQAWRDTMKSYGREITQAQFRSTFGWRNDAILADWLGSETTPDQVNQIGHAKEALFRQIVRLNGIEPLPGALEWVRRLRQASWRQAIASSAPRENVEAVLEALHFRESFEAVVTAEDVRQGKPEPEVFLKAASVLGVMPSQTIVVEDAAMGIEAARRAGMRSIGVSARSKLPASLHVASLADLSVDAFDRLLATDGDPFMVGNYSAPSPPSGG